MSILTQDDIHEFCRAAISAALTREALLVCIPEQVRAALSQASSTRDYFLIDLDQLNRMGQLSDGGIPLYIYLRNAVESAHLLQERVVFERLIERVEARVKSGLAAQRALEIASYVLGNLAPRTGEPASGTALASRSPPLLSGDAGSLLLASHAQDDSSLSFPLVLRLDEKTGRPALRLDDRSPSAVDALAADHLRNFVATINQLLAQLPPDSAVSEQSVPRRTIGLLVDAVKNVPHHDLQKLWGKLLADEVCKPDSHTARTLAVLQTLSPEDAKLFARVCPFVFYERDIIDEGDIFLQTSGVTYEQLLHLEDCGLIKCDTQFFFRSMNNMPLDIPLVYHGRMLHLFSPKIDLRIRFRSHRLSDAGTQIMRLTSHDQSPQFLERFSKLCGKHAISVLPTRPDASST